MKAAGFTALVEDEYKDAPAKLAAAAVADTGEGMGVSVCGGSGLGVTTVADGVTSL